MVSLETISFLAAIISPGLSTVARHQSRYPDYREFPCSSAHLILQLLLRWTSQLPGPANEIHLCVEELISKGGTINAVYSLS